MQETEERQVQSLGWEDPLEKEIATHSSILAWEIPWTEPGGLQSRGPHRVKHNWSDLASMHAGYVAEWSKNTAQVPRPQVQILTLPPPATCVQSTGHSVPQFTHL